MKNEPLTMPRRRLAAPLALTKQRVNANVHSMKQKKAQPARPTPGTVLGAKYRARCNELSNAQREKLGEDFLKLFYGR